MTYEVLERLELGKDEDNIREVTLSDGRYTLGVCQTFRASKVKALMIDFMQATSHISSKQAKSQSVNMWLVFNLFLIKHFTSLGLEHLAVKDAGHFAALLDIADQLLDSGLLLEIIQHFPVNEIERIAGSMAESVKLASTSKVVKE